eukprot:jgi/Bigna1/90390/estExt_fgenesh1_pg.C_690039
MFHLCFVLYMMNSYKLLLENIIASTPPLEFTTREDLSVSFRLITDITRHINHAMGARRRAQGFPRSQSLMLRKNQLHEKREGEGIYKKSEDKHIKPCSIPILKLIGIFLCHREGDEVKKILAIQSLFTGNVTLLAPHRRFILQKTVKKTTSHGDLVPRELFLFSDMLVYGAKNNFSRKLSLRHPLKINGLFRVEDDRLNLEYNEDCDTLSYRFHSAINHIFRPDDHPLYIASQARNMMVHFRSKEKLRFAVVGCAKADKDEFKIALDECIANRRQKIGYNNYRRGGMVSK